MKHLLTIRNLEIEARADEQWKPIVRNITLTLDRGEVLGLIGESGAGKSTIGLAAMGYTRTGCRIAGGSVLFNGTELTTASKEERRKLRGAHIAYMAQSAAAAFNPAHRLIHQFAEAPVQHGLSDFPRARDKAVALYERLFLPEPGKIGYRYPHEVSGGQLQRAMVAMSMACDPDIIIFDEPTTALDVTTQIEVLTAIREVTRQGNAGAIYITHDLAVVAQLADRIMVLRYGELIEEGNARELLADPKQEYTRELLSSRIIGKPQTQSEDKCYTVLEAENISAGYTKDVTVLDNISFQIERGKTVAVVGESGSGKTTVARVLTGLLPPSDGKIIFNGKEISPALKHRDRESLRRLQMIYQMPDVALNPRHKVRKILGRPLSFYFGTDAKARERRILELLEMIELGPEYMGRYPSELSGGEKQRICIARALAARPDVIICDEVTSALDQLVARGILKLLRELQKELGVSYLFITHDLATVKAVADEIIVMLQGKIVERGPKEDILESPGHEYTELLLSSVPETDPYWLDRLLKGRGPKFTRCMKYHENLFVR